jgi:hypothetical protein
MGLAQGMGGGRVDTGWLQIRSAGPSSDDSGNRRRPPNETRDSTSPTEVIDLDRATKTKTRRIGVRASIAVRVEDARPPASGGGDRPRALAARWRAALQGSGMSPEARPRFRSWPRWDPGDPANGGEPFLALADVRAGQTAWLAARQVVDPAGRPLMQPSNELSQLVVLFKGETRNHKVCDNRQEVLRSCTRGRSLVDLCTARVRWGRRCHDTPWRDATTNEPYGNSSDVRQRPTR